MKTQKFTLEQIGTNDPAIIVHENSFLYPLVATRQALGQYRIASPGNEFTNYKTAVDIPRLTVSDDTGEFVYVFCQCTSPDELNIWTYSDQARTTPVEWYKHALDGGFHSITVLD